MKILLYGKNAKDLLTVAKSTDLDVVEDRPDVIISYGGDGTLLASERKYPGIPKLPIRDSTVCKKCAMHCSEILLRSLAKNNLSLQSYPKLLATTEATKYQAFNDIVLRNSYPIHALRFRVTINALAIGEDVIIGDGLVAATTFGATGYFQSVTRKSFDQNFGLAFNNSTVHLDPLFFTENDIIEVEIIRGPAVLSFDNSPDMTTLQAGSRVTIKASDHKAQIYQLDTLRCPNCIISRDKRLD